MTRFIFSYFWWLKLRLPLIQTSARAPCSDQMIWQQPAIDAVGTYFTVTSSSMQTHQSSTYQWCLSYCNSLAIDHQPVMILQSFGGILGQGAITPEIHQWHWCSVLQDTRAFSWFSNLGGTQWLGSAKLWSVEGQTGEPNGEYPIFPFVSWLRIHKFLNMAKFEIIYIIHTAS